MEDKELYLVDYEKLGNVVKLYLGTKSQYDDSWGDDWDDVPWNSNAGTVYNEYVTKTIDIAFPSKDIVADTSNIAWDNRNSYSKEDIKKREAPAFVVMELPAGSYAWEYDTFDRIVGRAATVTFYLGDNLANMKLKIADLGGKIWE